MKIFIALALILWPAAIHPSVYDDCGGFETYGERAEFRKILKKHGLNYSVSVIWKDDRGWYFINDRGQRCPFK